MKNIYLIRHASTGDRYKDRYVGISDVPIAQDQQEAIANIKWKIADISFDLCLCSPMLRTRQTFDYLDIASDLITFDPRIKEIDFGRWENKNFQEICESDQELAGKWAVKPEGFQFPEGESLTAFKKRLTEVVLELTINPHKNILIVSHGGVIKMLICYLTGIADQHFLKFQIDAPSISILRVGENSGTLMALNCQ